MAITAESKSPATLRVLDGLRGGAALYVMIGHALWLLTLAPGPREGRLWWEWVQNGFRFLFRYGHDYVILFFVLSGLVIHLRLAQACQKGEMKFDLGRYLTRRITRIYPPL